MGLRELKLDGIIDKLSDNEFNDYCELLDVFIDTFPIQEVNLKNSFKAGDSQKFMDNLKGIKGMLIQIYANDLAMKSDRLLKSVTDPNCEMAEANISYFLTSVSMLSTEIQMVKHKNVSAEVKNEAVKANTEDNSQRSILAVDDVAFLLSTLRASLQNTDYKFTGVTSGEAALKFLSNHKVDLFLLDIEMPKMNGYE